jgi:multidrug efflux pump subunit AcrA (membrane-fusion protein)
MTLNINMALLTKVVILSLCLGTLAFANNVEEKLANVLKLTVEQQLAMGLQTAVAIKTDTVPSSIFPAQASIPLITRRSLSSPLSGQVIKLNYVHGPIKKGQIFTEIESPELLKIQESFLAVLSDLKIAKKSLNRENELNKGGISSTKKLQQAKLNVKKLSLTKDHIKKTLALVGMESSAIATLEQTGQLQAPILQIISPITGQLFDLKIRLGERVEKNSSLISLGKINPIILIVHVPVKLVNSLTEKQPVEIIGKQKKGIIEHIDPMVDPMTQSVDVHISVENNDMSLRTGQLFNIRFLSENLDQMLLEKEAAIYKISANANIEYQGKTVVFTQQGDRVKIVPIKVINISNQFMYFTPLNTSISPPLTIYTKGSTAIKSALDALDNSATTE